MRVFQHGPSFSTRSHQSIPEEPFPVAPPFSKALTSALVAAFLLCLGAGWSSSAQAQACVPNPNPDWMTTAFASNKGLAAPRPGDCQVVEQTPPDFTWPDIGGSYTLNLRFPDGHTESRTAAQNWFNWDATLPAGAYSWTVQSGAGISQVRQFTVSATAAPFVVPNIDAVVAQVQNKPHPRSLPDDATLAQMAAESERVTAISFVRDRVDSRLTEQLPDQGVQGDGNRYDGYGDRALDALMAYAYNRTNPTYIAEAKRRVLNLATWTVHTPSGGPGPTHIGDQESLYIAWVVTLGYDWLGSNLTLGENLQFIFPNLSTRIADLYGWVKGSNGWPFNESFVPPPLWSEPRDSHRYFVANAVAVMSTLLVGNRAEAQAWLQDLLPLSVNLLSPWGGEEGGYANGTAYGMFDPGASLLSWYALRSATCGIQQTCIDLAQKAWVRNYAKFLAYFTPATFAADLTVHNARAADPGTPIGLFGDGFAEAQLFEERSRFGKGYVNFAPSPLGCWYVSGLVGEDFTRAEYLMSPPNTCPSPPPVPFGTPHASYLPSTGWMAMHSNVFEPSRTSVYFKSSPLPFGAYNHGAADQNSLVINAGGERLLIESGYYGTYDGYATNHWQWWVKRTKSKNAITIDGGKGQIAVEHEPCPFLNDTMRYGSITQQQSAIDYEIVTGDATDAYQSYNGNCNGPITPLLSQAVRSVVYLRPGTILVYDNLASATPHSWEWNMHALNPFAVLSGTRGRIARGTQSLCIDILASPNWNFVPINGSDFTSWGTADDGVTSAAPLDPTAPVQNHGKLASTTPSTSAEFLVLLRVNATCDAANPPSDPAPVANKINGVWSVSVGGKTVTFDSTTLRAAVN